MAQRIRAKQNAFASSSVRIGGTSGAHAERAVALCTYSGTLSVVKIRQAIKAKRDQLARGYAKSGLSKAKVVNSIKQPLREYAAKLTATALPVMEKRMDALVAKRVAAACAEAGVTSPAIDMNWTEMVRNGWANESVREKPSDPVDVRIAKAEIRAIMKEVNQHMTTFAA